VLEALSSEELQFIKAIEKYKQVNGKLFLSWTEVLKIVKELGYRKTTGRDRARAAEPQETETSSG
jgi:hypothetical protein